MFSFDALIPVLYVSVAVVVASYTPRTLSEEANPPTVPVVTSIVAPLSGAVLNVRVDPL